MGMGNRVIDGDRERICIFRQAIMREVCREGSWTRL